MRKSILFIALVTLLSLSVVGCQSYNIKQFSDSTKEIHLKAGEQFSIILESNPSTGYKWVPEYDKEIIELIDDRYESLNKNQQIVGAPGKQIFVFKALKKGDTEIKFEYGRSWEKVSIDSRVFRISIEL